ncbi:MAG: sugar phosphate nucleotidyltransferase, partial [Endomicrobia bacterium]|nr:sugar phosphate nucleotidyltransferase [Endomicrobiia bacterium]
MISIILAGGAGTRLWPLSRKFWPKFLLKLDNNKYSLLQQTFLRVKEFTEVDKIFIVVNKEHKFLVKENIQDLGLNFPLDNIIVEPEIKNTLPAITLACKVIKSRFTDREIVGVFPSDHIIKPEKTFKDFILKAGKVAESGYIVLFGVKPNRVETGYGHIKLNTSQKLKIKHFKGVYFVEKFIEKPSFATANNLISSNSVYWNSG